MSGGALARFELVLTILAGPMAPNGEAERGGSIGTSFHGSVDTELVSGAETTRGLGANVAALALRIRGELTGELDKFEPAEVAEVALMLDELCGKVGT